MQERNSSPPRKPWPMRWIVLTIAAFVIFYTFVTVRYRKEDTAHLPYESSQIRGGHELRASGWIPFPNAYGMAGDSPELDELPVGPGDLQLREIPFETLSRDDPQVANWSDELPPLEQGEQLRRVTAPETVAAGKPYLARLLWEVPEDFRSPQLVVFRKENQILIVPRAPQRIDPGSRDETVLIIPPDLLETGEYEVFLSTEGRVNRWTFQVE